jgi:outer membrane protein TolC
MTYIFIGKGRIGSLLFIAGLICISFAARAQNKSNTNALPPLVAPDTTKNTLLAPVVLDTSKNAKYLTLQQCIDYALLHQPALNRSLINVDITRTTNAINLAGLLPQVSASGNLTHNIQRNQNVNNSNFAGFANTFVPGLAVTQNIFTPSLLYASKTAQLFVKQAEQVTDSTKIFVVSAVSKSFYNVLLNLEQINVLKEDTARLGKNVRDTYHQYKGGIVDETNYEEAEITLNNSRAQLKQATENVVPQYASLKQLMGYPPEQQFNVNFDTLQMMSGIYVDTTQLLQYEKRIEFQQLNTNKSLQKELINYYHTSFIPTVSAFFNYRLNFQNNTLPDIFSSSYPTSLVGLSFSVPIFTGFSRLNNLKKARLQYQLLDWDETGLRLVIYREYTAALANYKSNFYNLQLLQKNVALAKRVYFVVNLQYKQGVVPYLNVITAESNLITSEINYLNALFQVLSSKIDLQKAIGNISY